MSDENKKHGSSWDEDAKAGEKCCKEIKDREYLETIDEVPKCGKPATKAIVTDEGERLPFCSYHWTH